MSQGFQERLLTFVASAALSCAAAQAVGQGSAQAGGGSSASASESGEGLEEVIVTARGRQEDLQQVPLSIVAFTDEQIAAGGLSDLRDLSKLAPNLVVYSGSGRADATALVVRGLSPSTSDERYQGLSTFVDGLYVSGQVTGLDFGDVEQVEVIYGPQSVRFGRATYSGAINYITRTPDSDELRSRVRLGLSSNGGRSDLTYRYGGSLEFPLRPETAWLSVYASKSKVGSLFPDAETGGPVGEERTTSFGATLFTRFGENTTARLRVTSDRDDDSVGLLYTAQPTDWGTAAAGEYAYPAVVAGMAVTGRWIRGAIPDPRRGLTGQNVNLVGGVDPRTTDTGYPNSGGRDRERRMISLALSTQLDNGWDVSYSGAYYKQTYWAYEDFLYRSRTKDPVFAPLGRSLAANFAPANIIGFKEEFTNESHQLRLASNGERLRWSAGLYYFDEDNRNSRGAEIGRTAFQISPATYAATGPFARYASIVNVDGRTRGDEGIENKAAFAGVEYDFTDRWNASLEGRYAEETVSYDACVFCGTINEFDRATKDSSFDPRVIVKYRFADDDQVYLQYATGVKSGRYNNNIATNYLFAKPEELDAYELGVKTTSLDGRLRFNAALFWQTIDNQQLLGTYVNPLCTPVPGSSVACVEPNQGRTFTGADTAGNSEIYGFDLQARWRITDRFTLSGNGGYSHHEWKEQFVLQSGLSDVLLFAPGETLVGNTTINTPRVTGTLTGEYTMPLGGSDRYELALRGDAVHVGKRYIDQANVAYIDAVTRINLRAALQREDGASFALFVRDLTDEETQVGAGISGTSACNFPEPAGTAQRCYLATVPRGREVGVELNFRF